MLLFCPAWSDCSKRASLNLGSITGTVYDSKIPRSIVRCMTDWDLTSMGAYHEMRSSSITDGPFESLDASSRRD